MSIPYSEEQLEFQEAFRKVLEGSFPLDETVTLVDDQERDDSLLWKKLDELGLRESFSCEAVGGFSLGFEVLALFAFEAGRVILPLPATEQLFFGSYVATQLKQLISSPEDRVSSCFGSQFSDLQWKGDAVSGEVRQVSDIEEIKGIWVKTPKNIWAFVTTPLEKIDSKVSLDLAIQRYTAKINGSAVSLTSEQSTLVDHLRATLIANEIAGICNRVVDLTKEYVVTRKQFGREIGSFQAVQHKLVDMYVTSEALRNLARFAGWTKDNSIEQLPLASTSALLYALEHGSSVIESAIQIHGGIGFTWEHPLHLFLRRCKWFEAALAPQLTQLESQLVEIAQQ